MTATIIAAPGGKNTAKAFVAPKMRAHGVFRAPATSALPKPKFALFSRALAAVRAFFTPREPFVMGRTYTDHRGNQWRCEGYRHPWENTPHRNKVGDGAMEFTPLFTPRSRFKAAIRHVARDRAGYLFYVPAKPAFGDPDFIIRPEVK